MMLLLSALPSLAAPASSPLERIPWSLAEKEPQNLPGGEVEGSGKKGRRPKGFNSCKSKEQLEARVPGTTTRRPPVLVAKAAQIRTDRNGSF